MSFRHYIESDYDIVHDFLLKINRDDDTYLNWNWARLEWMIAHPYFDYSLINKIGLWFIDDNLVGIAIFDMYLGECNIITLKEYHHLYNEILEYAYKYLSDEDGLGIYVNDRCIDDINILTDKGYIKRDMSETLSSLDIIHHDISLRDDIYIKEINPYDEYQRLSYLIYQGFDHGDNYDEFLSSYSDTYRIRKYHDNSINLVAVDSNNQYIGYICGWYDKSTNYAYLEPLCVIPAYRHMGIARALIYELSNRMLELGASRLIVLSDSEIYMKIGFKPIEHYSLYYKYNSMMVNDKRYIIHRLLGKGKGGYSYLASIDDRYVVIKQIHHEPCSYYTFGNKIEAECNDYHRLTEAGIRIPKMLDIDRSNERIVKEYIDGPTIYDLIKDDIDVSKYIEQVKEMASLAKEHGLNIDYFPTNFVVMNETLYYIDYECNQYMDEWSYDNWGYKYWYKSREFIDYINHK